MRQITSHRVNPANDKLSILVTDEPGAGGANHRYVIGGANFNVNPSLTRGDSDHSCVVLFQNGPINENGVNGITQEVLLAILIDRLQSFQMGNYACRENQIALTHLETAKLWLHSRTLDRMSRGVEGTHAK
jgi:hypothetical protein